MTYELVAFDWSDYPQLTESEIMATVEADTEKQAADAFRKLGFLYGYVREAGSSLSRELDLIIHFDRGGGP